jgi:hypothetical protein
MVENELSRIAQEEMVEKGDEQEDELQKNSEETTKEREEMQVTDVFEGEERAVCESTGSSHHSTKNYHKKWAKPQILCGSICELSCVSDHKTRPGDCHQERSGESGTLRNTI